MAESLKEFAERMQGEGKLYGCNYQYRCYPQKSTITFLVPLDVDSELFPEKFDDEEDSEVVLQRINPPEEQPLHVSD